MAIASLCTDVRICQRCLRDALAKPTQQSAEHAMAVPTTVDDAPSDGTEPVSSPVESSDVVFDGATA
jgi:hypothetical protein